MRTCRFCGCYLPDKLSVCVACHRDNNKIESLPDKTGTHSTKSVLIYDYNSENGHLDVKKYEYIPGKYRYSCRSAQERFDQTLSDITKYEQYCKDHNEKPMINIPNASLLYEMDTMDLYMFDTITESWIRQSRQS